MNLRAYPCRVGRETTHRAIFARESTRLLSCLVLPVSSFESEWRTVQGDDGGRKGEEEREEVAEKIFL